MLLNLLEDQSTINTVFSYLFGSIGKYEFRARIGDKAKAKSVWSLVADNGYVLKNCKLYAYAVYRNRTLGIPTSPAKYGIHDADVKILRKLDLSHIKKPFKAYSVFDFDNLEGSIISSKEMKAYIGKFISRKLIFIVRSYGVSREDIEGQLICAAMFAVRKNYPFYETDLHALNTGKTAIHNCGMGIIEFWTRTKRNALLKENGGFQAVHVSYDVLSNVGVMPEHDDELRLNMKSIQSLAGSMSKVEQAFLRAASGAYDAGFSMFLGKDNRDVVEKLMYDRYLSLLSRYHRFEPDRQNALLGGLRKALI